MIMRTLASPPIFSGMVVVDRIFTWGRRRKTRRRWPILLSLTKRLGRSKGPSRIRSDRISKGRMIEDAIC